MRFFSSVAQRGNLLRYISLLVHTFIDYSMVQHPNNDKDC